MGKRNRKQTRLFHISTSHLSSAWTQILIEYLTDCLLLILYLIATYCCSIIFHTIYFPSKIENEAILYALVFFDGLLLWPMFDQPSITIMKIRTRIYTLFKWIKVNISYWIMHFKEINNINLQILLLNLCCIWTGLYECRLVSYLKLNSRLIIS